MKYLFFDIETIVAETINPRIVSFGYVLTDEQFNEISKEDVFINPQEETEAENNWQWKQDATKDKKGFKAFYHKIKDLLEDKNNIVVGHGTGNDVQYLMDECERFHFEPIDFDYMDTKIIADLLLVADAPKKLGKLYEYLCPDGNRFQWHRSLDDACMTKEVFVALLNKATSENINIAEKAELVFNSLRRVYGKLADVAKKDEGYFSCNFDVPIIGIKAKCNYTNGIEQKSETLYLYYDYAIDCFFTPKHPKKGNIKANSLLPDSAYETAKRRAVYKINKLWNTTKESDNPLNFFYKEKYELADMQIKHILYTLTSYEVYARFKRNFLEFDFKVPVSSNYLKNAIGNKKCVIVDLKRVIKTIHTAETANKSMLLMAKMKFGYKDENFPKIHLEELPYSENVEYTLAKQYADLLKQPNIKKGTNDRLLNDDTIFVPTENAFDNNLFEERLVLPVLAKIRQ